MVLTARRGNKIFCLTKKKKAMPNRLTHDRMTKLARRYKYLSLSLSLSLLKRLNFKIVFAIVKLLN